GAGVADAGFGDDADVQGAGRRAGGGAPLLAGGLGPAAAPRPPWRGGLWVGGGGGADPPRPCAGGPEQERLWAVAGVAGDGDAGGGAGLSAGGRDEEDARAGRGRPGLLLRPGRRRQQQAGEQGDGADGPDGRSAVHDGAPQGETARSGPSSQPNRGAGGVQ